MRRVAELVKDINLDEAIYLTSVGVISYYVFRDGILVVSEVKELHDTLPYLNSRTKIIPFEEMPPFLEGIVKRVISNENY